MAQAKRQRAGARSFGPELFSFLVDLREHNDREWFAANKARYEEDVREPAIAFIEDFAPRLATISSHLRADPRPVGGSLFRIHRDVRFSKDKSPYKTSVGIQFRHESAENVSAPGFYLHLEPGSVFVGGGVWRPDGKALARIRDSIAVDPDGWLRATRSRPFAKRFTLGGESLKRPPAGYDPGHPLIDDLKRKDFFGSTVLTEADAVAPGFLDSYTEACRSAAPLMRFACEALELPF